MKIKSLWSIVALCCFIPGYAQDIQKVILKDGSELVGYISRQRPGENLTFTTQSATIMTNTEKVRSIVDHQVNAKDLSKEWKQWAEKNSALMGTGDNAHLTLSDIVMSNGTVNHVRIRERGSKVKYLELRPNNYSLSWDTITMIKAEPRPKLQLSGINRKYKLRSGMEYQGQYVEEIPGKTLSLYQDDGVTLVFNRDEVLKDNRYKINPNQTLFEQSGLIDIVQLKNGKSHKGIIIERNYSDTDTISNDYLLIQAENGSIQSISLADVLEYRKEPNPAYKPLTDILLNEGEFVVNRNKVVPQAVQESKGTILFNTDSVEVVIPAGTPSTEIIIESKFTDNIQASQLKLVRAKEYHDKKEKKTVHGLTYEDIVKEAVRPQEAETSINGITKITFSVKGHGIYSLYNPSKKEVILFRID